SLSNGGLTNVFVQVVAAGVTNVYAGTGGGGVYRSTNNGGSWATFNNGLTNLNISALIVKDSNVFAGTVGGGIFRSTNNGLNWTALSTGLTDMNIRTFTFRDSNLYSGTEGGVFHSTDNGNNWTPVNTNLLNLDIRSLAINDSNLFAGTYGDGVFKKRNTDSIWTAVNTDLTGKNIFSLRTNGTNIFAGSDSGVFLTKNNGANWINRNQGFAPKSPVAALLTTSSFIYAGVISQSVWRRDLTDIIGIQFIEGNVPVNYLLHQNYPNPFNPSTRIRYEIPQTGFVTVRIFDMLGKEVETLVNENLNAGTYEATFNASNYSSGVYFYSLQTQNFTETKRMVVVK
ncbi:MAG: T9SS type A sorting domain-containing protein, partial [Ignavibacteria bacterium]